MVEISFLVFCWCCLKSTLVTFRSAVLCFCGYTWIPVLLESGRTGTPGPGWTSRGALRPLPPLSQQTWHCLHLCDRDKDLASSWIQQDSSSDEEGQRYHELPSAIRILTGLRHSRRNSKGQIPLGFFRPPVGPQQRFGRLVPEHRAVGRS